MSITAKYVPIKGKSGKDVECACGSEEDLARVTVDGEEPPLPHWPQVVWEFYVCAPCRQIAEAEQAEEQNYRFN
tara:strand:+ start:1817 stop:2038 length:222 start_codon:yes stop_codon:yes gene_type:complete